MKKYAFILFLLLFFLHSLNAQNDIKGFLVDEISGEPIPYATIYINDTSNGTISDTNGNFVLKHSKFPCKLIIRHLGYNRVVFNLNKGANLKEISLKPQVLDITEIQIEAENHREENLRLFKEAFLGKDSWGQKAKILNEDDIRFHRKDINETILGQEFTLVANAVNPIKVEMPLLGYLLQMDLIMFEKTPISQAQKGYFYFQPIDNLSKRKEKVILKNRKAVYYNSSIHFLRSLCNNCLKEQGYSVLEKSWDKEMRKPKYTPVKLDSFLVDAENIKYFKNMKDNYFHILFYSNTKNDPIDLTGEKRRLPNPEQSGIQLLEDSCTIRKNGTMPGISIAYSGTIGIKQVGASLPADYQPPSQ